MHDKQTRSPSREKVSSACVETTQIADAGDKEDVNHNYRKEASTRRSRRIIYNAVQSLRGGGDRGEGEVGVER